MVDRRDWMYATLVALATTGLLCLPYLLGYALARPGWEFTGVIMNPEDTQSYFAKILEGYDGAWLYTIPFTATGHAPAFVGGFYLFLGHLARALGVSIVAIWHGARVVADLGLFLVTFGTLGAWTTDRRVRWTAYLLALFGSGLGWLLFLLNEPNWLGWFPVDFKMPEAHLFFTALTFPHVAFGTACVLLSFWASLRSLASFGARGWLLAFGAGLANLGLAIAYPFLIYLMIAVMGVWWLALTMQARRILGRETTRLALAFALPAPLSLYYAYTLATNEVFRVWDAQSITLSPPWPHYAIAYGVLVACALLPFAKRVFRARTRRLETARAWWRYVLIGEADTGSAHTVLPHAFLWVWVLVSCALLYAPVNAQRRFVQGLQVPLSLLAAEGVCLVALPWMMHLRPLRWLAAQPRYSRAGLERLALVGFLAFASLSNAYVLASTILTASVQQPYPLFRAKDEVEAVAWLRAHTPASAVVLAAYETGNYIAARGGNHVVVGHWTESMDWETNDAAAQRFFKGEASSEEQRVLLTALHVEYIWWGQQERALGGWSPPQSAPVFANASVAIYRVELP